MDGQTKLPGSLSIRHQIQISVRQQYRWTVSEFKYLGEFKGRGAWPYWQSQ